MKLKKNFKKGLAETIQFMGIPSDERIEEEIANQKSAKGKQRIRQYYAKMKKQALFETSLYKYKKVQRIAWDPEVTTTGIPERHADFTLKGWYICLYKYENDAESQVEVPANWVEFNFGVTALAYAQQLAYDALKKQLPMRMEKQLS